MSEQPDFYLYVFCIIREERRAYMLIRLPGSRYSRYPGGGSYLIPGR